MTWIESHVSLGRHPKTKRLCRLLGISLPEAIGHLHLLWYWVLEFAEHGDVTGFEPDDIADGAHWTNDAQRFVDALVQAGFLDRVEDRLVVHDWGDYVGRLLADRERKRAARQRAKEAANPQTVSEASAPVDGPSEERPRTVRGLSETVRANRNLNRNPNHNHTEVSPETSEDIPPVSPLAVTEQPAPDSGAGAPAVLEQPFDLLEALCEELGVEASALGRSERAKQLAVAKRLAEGGVTAEDVRRQTRWLLSQAWVTGGIDLFLLEKQHARWVLAGRPDAAALPRARAPTATVQRGRCAACGQVGPLVERGRCVACVMGTR